MLKVDLNTVLCEDFRGAGAVYHGFCHMPFQAEKGMAESDCEREYALIERARLSIARTWFRPDWTCAGSIHAPFDFTTPELEAFCRWLARNR
ncbi:hypothetical protein ACFLSJ_05150 [Verrucomicrobiota bacterium]